MPRAGARMVPLTSSSADVLTGLPHTPGNPRVFPGKKKDAPLRNIKDSWEHGCADLDGVRLHDLRHSCASLPYSLAA